MCLCFSFPLTQTKYRFQACVSLFTIFKSIDIVCALRLYILLFYSKINTRIPSLSSMQIIYKDAFQVSGFIFILVFFSRLFLLLVTDAGGFSAFA